MYAIRSYYEREVVREERRRSYESSPDGMLYENLIADAFTVHPYRHPVIGWDSDISNLSLAETRDFLHHYYAPVNTVIALVGDVDTEAAIAMVERYFGPRITSYNVCYTKLLRSRFLMPRRPTSLTASTMLSTLRGSMNWAELTSLSRSAVIAMVERYFGPIAAGTPVPPVTA